MFRTFNVLEISNIIPNIFLWAGTNSLRAYQLIIHFQFSVTSRHGGSRSNFSSHIILL